MIARTAEQGVEALVRSLALATGMAACILAPAASAQRTAALPNSRPDLADAAAGIYRGDVISDSRGSSRSGVTITITKTGPNTIEVVSSYSRLPAVSTGLERVMDTIQNTGTLNGPLEVFLLNTAGTPMRLDLTIDGASWSGEKTG